MVHLPLDLYVCMYIRIEAISWTLSMGSDQLDSIRGEAIMLSLVPRSAAEKHCLAKNEPLHATRPCRLPTVWTLSGRRRSRPGRNPKGPRPTDNYRRNQADKLIPPVSTRHDLAGNELQIAERRANLFPG